MKENFEPNQYISLLEEKIDFYQNKDESFYKDQFLIRQTGDRHRFSGCASRYVLFPVCFPASRFYPRIVFPCCL